MGDKNLFYVYIREGVCIVTSCAYDLLAMKRPIYDLAEAGFMPTVLQRHRAWFSWPAKQAVRSAQPSLSYFDSKQDG